MIGKAFAAIVGRWQLSLAILGSILVCFGLSYCKGRSDGSAMVEARYAAARLEAVQRARKADAVGQGAADASKGAVEAENAKAREAAKDSADPLKSGLEALR